MNVAKCQIWELHAQNNPTIGSWQCPHKLAKFISYQYYMYFMACVRTEEIFFIKELTFWFRKYSSFIAHMHAHTHKHTFSKQPYFHFLD